MKQLAATLLLAVSGIASAQSSAMPAMASPDAVTVVVQIATSPGVKPDQALPAMMAMRSHVAKQPGFLQDEFLQNANPGATPSYVHVMRWASLKYWESVFISPEFAKLNAAGSKSYSITANAFKTVK